MVNSYVNPYESVMGSESRYPNMSFTLPSSDRIIG